MIKIKTALISVYDKSGILELAQKLFDNNIEIISSGGTSKYLKENNIKTFNGLDMLIYQGQKSFYLWNKVNPEIDNELIDLLISKLK